MDKDINTGGTNTAPICDHTGNEVPDDRKRTASQHPLAVKARKRKWKETGNTKRGKVEFSFTTDFSEADFIC